MKVLENENEFKNINYMSVINFTIICSTSVSVSVLSCIATYVK